MMEYVVQQVVVRLYECIITSSECSIAKHTVSGILEWVVAQATVEHQ